MWAFGELYNLVNKHSSKHNNEEVWVGFLLKRKRERVEFKYDKIIFPFPWGKKNKNGIQWKAKRDIQRRNDSSKAQWKEMFRTQNQVLPKVENEREGIINYIIIITIILQDARQEGFKPLSL